jgi:DNA-binding response OmpR family regulator
MAHHRPTVLIVEDEPFVSMLYEEIITDAGLSVGGSFASCESAEEWLSLHDPDVAIIDIKLQDGNSAELAKKLRGRKIPFLVVSGYPAESDGIDEIFKSAPWVAKPVTVASLQLALRTLVASECDTSFFRAQLEPLKPQNDIWHSLV